jgi:hypothetical protein
MFKKPAILPSGFALRVRRCSQSATAACAGGRLTTGRLLHPHVNPPLKNGGTFTTTTKAMADVHLPATRGYNMSRIKSKNTQPEMLVRRLHDHGFRYLLHAKKLPGKPDMILPKYRTVIFVHGCFWHGHARCKYYVAPKT